MHICSIINPCEVNIRERELARSSRLNNDVAPPCDIDLNHDGEQILPSLVLAISLAWVNSYKHV